MAKLQFIKLDIEIMNDSKIKMIRKMPDGAKLFELWIGLLCLGMKSGRPGCVEIGDGLPFNSRMLSAELDIPETTIELGLQTFSDLRMIEQFEDSTYFLSNFEKHQELEKIEIKRINERDRKRKYRDKVKLLSHGTGQGQDGDGTKCPTVDKDIDIDKEEDKDQYKNTDLIIDYFNEITGQKRRHSKTSRAPINSRLSEGFKITECMHVIKVKYEEWKDNKDMQKHITIETFFRPSNFEKYLNQELEKPPQEDTFHVTMSTNQGINDLVDRAYNG